MRISIITINRNHKEGLKKTIDSVISQSYKDFEWIVIDGDSTDGSKELMAQYRDAFSYWTSEPDKGIFNAMNKGIRASRGEYLLFLNSGDYLFDDKVLSYVVPYLKGKDFYVGNEQHPEMVMTPKIDTLKDLYAHCTFLSFPHQSTFIHRRIFSEYGLYLEDKQVASDWWMYYRALILGHATIEKIDLTISVFEGNGISYSQMELCQQERQQLLADIPRVHALGKFCMHYYEFIEALTGTRWFFFIFRIYFYFYRKWLKKNKHFEKYSFVCYRIHNILLFVSITSMHGTLQ